MNPTESTQLYNTLIPIIQISSLSVLSLLFLQQHLDCSASLRSAPLTQELRHEAEKAAKKNLTLLITAGTIIAMMTPISWLTGKYSSLIFFTIILTLTLYWIYEAKETKGA